MSMVLWVSMIARHAMRMTWTDSGAITPQLPPPPKPPNRCALHAPLIMYNMIKCSTCYAQCFECAVSSCADWLCIGALCNQSLAYLVLCTSN
jgi:hypothetical protein